MTQERGGRPDVSFVIRLWLKKRGASDQPEWRFQARHVPSGEERQFQQVSELLAFIEQWAPGETQDLVEGSQRQARPTPS